MKVHLSLLGAVCSMCLNEIEWKINAGKKRNWYGQWIVGHIREKPTNTDKRVTRWRNQKCLKLFHASALFPFGLNFCQEKDGNVCTCCLWYMRDKVLMRGARDVIATWTSVEKERTIERERKEGRDSEIGDGGTQKVGNNGRYYNGTMNIAELQSFLPSKWWFS